MNSFDTGNGTDHSKGDRTVSLPLGGLPSLDHHSSFFNDLLPRVSLGGQFEVGHNLLEVEEEVDQGFVQKLAELFVTGLELASFV